MKKYKIGNKVVYANSLHDALEIYKHKVKDEVYYEDIDSSSEAKKYAKKFRLEVEGRRAPWGGYEFVFEGSPQDLKKLVQELKRIGIEPTWSSVGDSKVKDRDFDVDRYTAYLWKWYDSSDRIDVVIEELEKGLNKSNLTESNIQKNIKNAEKKLDQVYRQLQQNIQSRLKEGYEVQKEKIQEYAGFLRESDAYVKDSKVKDKDWADYLRDVLDDENIDYNGIGSDYATFDNEDDMEDAIFILERQEGRKLRVDRKKLEVKILK